MYWNEDTIRERKERARLQNQKVATQGLLFGLGPLLIAALFHYGPGLPWEAATHLAVIGGCPMAGFIRYLVGSTS